MIFTNEMTMVCWKTHVFACIVSIYNSVLVRKTESVRVLDYHINNITWFQTKLHVYNTLFYELNFHVTFPMDSCCPILLFGLFESHIAYKDKDQTTDCFFDVIMHYANWFKHTLYFLQPGKQVTPNVGCKMNSTSGLMDCFSGKRVVAQSHRAIMRWLIIGYPCQGIKHMKNLHVHIEMYKEVNQTACESMMNFDYPGNTIQCNRYYQYTSFPNAFGDNTQAEAARGMDLFKVYFNERNKESYCHKDVLRFICLMYFMKCPIDSKEFTVNNTHQTMIAPYLEVVCNDLALSIVEACGDELQPFMDIIMPNLEWLESAYGCYNNSVTCRGPPIIANGKLVNEIKNKTYAVKSKVEYICDNNYVLLNDMNFSECKHSGYWSNSPICKVPSTSSKTTTSVTIISVIAGVFISVIINIVILLVCKWKKNTGSYEMNEKRNRPYDAFVSYETGGEDEKFVRNDLILRFDQEYNGEFKLLIHQRDFHAGTLILANIQYAVRDSNCAIILLSSMFIKSRWCQQEFEECMVESRKDPSYRLIVILMQPIEMIENDKLSCYMTAFIRNRTYLTVTDKRLWEKVESILQKARGDHESLSECKETSV